jgi:chemotaxis protein CheY-P-specific phosphatase CheC
MNETDLALNEDQQDCLQELVNIAMGQAGDSLARLLEVFVHLSVPRIQVVAKSGLTAALSELLGHRNLVSAVRQGFHSQFDHSDVRGEAIVVFSDSSVVELAELLAYEDAMDVNSKKELLLDVTNVVSSACLTGIGEQLEIDIGYSAPTLLGQQIPIEQVIDEKHAWQQALLIDINYSVDNRALMCHLMMMMPDLAILALKKRIDEILAEY